MSDKKAKKSKTENMENDNLINDGINPENMPLITEDLKVGNSLNETLITDSRRTSGKPFDHFANLSGRSFNISYRGKTIYESGKGNTFMNSGDEIIVDGLRYKKSQVSLNIY